MQLEDIHKNNRQMIANYIQIKIDQLKEETKQSNDITIIDCINLFEQAKQLILESNIQ